LCEAIRIAKKQKSVSLAKRAEATYAEYRRQKASGSGGRGFRLLLHLLENLESAQALNVLILYRITVKTHGLSEKQKP
jgi:hypothetical protein